MDAFNALLQNCDVRLNEIAGVFGRWCDWLEGWSNDIESQYPYLTTVIGLPVIFVFVLPFVSSPKEREIGKVRTKAISDHDLPTLEILSQRLSASEMCNSKSNLQTLINLWKSEGCPSCLRREDLQMNVSIESSRYRPAPNSTSYSFPRHKLHHHPKHHASDQHWLCQTSTAPQLILSNSQIS